MMGKHTLILLILLILHVVGAPPVDPKKKEGEEEEQNELDDLGLEYGRYLQQVVQALEEDKDFAKKLENVSTEHIKSGDLAKELEFVKHNVRTKLDELKRIELERLRKLTREEMERSELGVYRNEEGHVAPPSIDGRRWRTISSAGGGDPLLGPHRKNAKMLTHVDLDNPRSFEVEDLRKLMRAATRDLEELDRRRREEFKQYEMEKEHQYRESLANLTEEEKQEKIKHHEEMIQKHKDHPKIHHPGSKQQLEQVWEEQDNMQGNEFDPRVFFAMHDINGDGYLDEQEIEAILSLEVKKMYDPRNGEDDPVEMMEEYNRMREHIYKETDANKDGLISKKEFMDMTKRSDFEQDDGWKGLDEQQIYTEEDIKEYEKRRQEYLQRVRGDHHAGYPVGHGPGSVPVQHHGNVPPMPQYQAVPPQGGYHQQPHHQPVPMQQGVYYQQPQHQAAPQGGHQQQPQHQAVPQGGHQQQFQHQAVPQGGHHQQQTQYGNVIGGQPQMQHQQVPPQQYYQYQPVQGVQPQQPGIQYVAAGQQVPTNFNGVPPHMQAAQSNPSQPHSTENKPNQQGQPIPNEQHPPQNGQHTENEKQAQPSRGDQAPMQQKPAQTP